MWCIVDRVATARRRLARDWPGDGSFLWATGIEDTFIGQPIRYSGRPLDEYILTQHDRSWRQDLDLAASLGVRGLRYGLPWYRINPEPGRFDWTWSDEVLAHAAGALGLRVIIDLVHYGTPDWLEGGFVDPDYPRAVAAFAGAVAERYRPLVSAYTPINEPIVTADLCGRSAYWPPYLEGDEGWVRVLAGITAGARETIRAIRAADSAALIVHVEASTFVVGPAELPDEATRVVEHVYLPTDLLLGRVLPGGAAARWLLERGMDERLIAEFATDPPRVDVMGVNYYPDISARALTMEDDRLVDARIDGWEAGLRAVLIGYHQRYDLPVLLTETSTIGSDARRLAWLEASVRSIGELREGGLPVLGYTWWPLFDLVDWDYAAADHGFPGFTARIATASGSTETVQLVARREGQGVAAYLARMGAWALEMSPDGTLVRRETPVAVRMRTLTGHDPGEMPMAAAGVPPAAWETFDRS